MERRAIKRKALKTSPETSPEKQARQYTEMNSGFFRQKTSVASGPPNKRCCPWSSGDMEKSTRICKLYEWHVSRQPLSNNISKRMQMRERKFHRRAIKRKALFACGAPNKRRCLVHSVTDMKKHICSGSMTLLMLIIGAQDSYMKTASGLYQFINTCVPDTLLASFHFLYMKHLHIRALLASNGFFKVLMDTLNRKKYTYARALWIRQLEDFYKLDRFSNIKDHFPVIDQLVCAKVDYHQETPSAHPIYEKTLSKFRPFGDLRALGDISDPALILVHRDVKNRRYDHLARYIPPLAVVDDNKSGVGEHVFSYGYLNLGNVYRGNWDARSVKEMLIFELEVLVVGKDQHMFMYYKLSDSRWIRYDNSPGIPLQCFDFKSLTIEGASICSAIYVNTTQEEDYKLKLSLGPDCVLKQNLCFPKDELFYSIHKDHESMQDLEMIMENLSIC